MLKRTRSLAIAAVLTALGLASFVVTPEALAMYMAKGVLVTPAGRITDNEMFTLAGVTAGTAAASKAVVVDANKDIATLRNVTVTNLDAGTSGTAGSVDIFPSTASRGKITLSATNTSSGNHQTTITTAAQTGAYTYTIPDVGASSEFTMQQSGVKAAGGFTVSPRLVHTGGNPAMVSTDGTNLSAVVTELYVAETDVAYNMTITGVSVFWGDATEGNAKVMLFDDDGDRVAISASTDISGYTTDSYGSRIAFSSPYAAKGPATYYVGVICDSSSNRINTHTLGNFGAGKITGLVYATEAGYADITPPTTFTTGQGPIATLY